MKKRTRKRIMSAFLALCITASVGTCGPSAQAAQPSEDTMDGEESAVYELNTKSESFFDIGDYVPEREGYTFAGWCYKASALYDSLIEDTSNYDWMNNTSGYDIQLYAKWAEETDKELEANGFRFDEATGELKIVTGKGVLGWNKLCSSTNGECKAQVKSLYIGGDVTSVGSSLFSDCINLKSVVLADAVKYINSCAFMNCVSLQSVKMSGVTNISNSAFENCSSLRRITFPEKLAYMDSNAFKNCTSLEIVKFEKTSSASNLYVASDAFEQCSPSLVIYVDSSLVDKFKEKYMPAYADKIMSDEFETEVIDNVEIVNTVLSYNVGDKPVFTGTVPDGAPYCIEYEGWEGGGEFISSSDYWNSAYVE